ncbi:ATP-binding protein [Marinobacter sp. ANT_B65]|uniref:ATP-binding protein n=1 Tax=Marinobacter sp. ANT_B65 TaxID=2039467 RepID=UPI000BBE990F|nr:ATP-binding protein [Marinobacter sp. ANT_B65]PCM43533.1 hybrid sensor histidine kinase/response regulator [Marinobacter sp. ANT_B65]
MHLFSNLKLTSKIVMLVILLGALAVGITFYSMTNLYDVNHNYRALLNRDAQASLLINEAILDLSDSSKLVLSVLTEQEVAKMRATQEKLKNLQIQLNDKITRIAPLLDEGNSKLDAIQQQKEKVFALADAIINSAARWRGDKALNIIHEDFDPQLNAMRQDMDDLKEATVERFQRASQTLDMTTRNTLFNTTLLFSLALVTVIGLSAYLSFTQISRPIKQLTNAMRRLSTRDYQQNIQHTQRHDEVGEMAKALQVFRDTMLRADRLEVEAAANARARELAEQVAQAKANFLATMSHEIRTPMNAILGLAQLSLRHPLEPRQKDRVEKIMRAGEHLLGIINDILDYSKIDSGRVSVEAISFSPEELLTDVEEMLEETTESKGLSLVLDVKDCPDLLVGDPMRISQILLNYTNNALKFSDHGQIVIRLKSEQETDKSLYLYGEVEDQGIGLDDEQIQQLFQPFHQADNSISRRFGGTGLGLAISRNLAELMGGSTGVHSTPGQGSTFWFRVRVYLPEADETIPATAPLRQQLEPTHNLHGLRLLLVDDNELNRLVASELLMDAGILVDSASDGQKALDMLEASADNTYDVILMDMMMPELDGLSATRRLRRNPRFRQIPVIAMTANVTEQDVASCLEAGMNAHVAKPVDDKALLRILAEHCKKSPSRALDPRPLEHLKRLIAPEKFNNMIDMLLEDCQQRGQVFQSLTAQTEPQQLLQHAHDLIGTAGHVGLNNLKNLGEALKRATRDSDAQAIQKLVQEIHHATMDATQELQRHFQR